MEDKEFKDSGFTEDNPYIDTYDMYNKTYVLQKENTGNLPSMWQGRKNKIDKSTKPELVKSIYALLRKYNLPSLKYAQARWAQDDNKSEQYDSFEQEITNLINRHENKKVKGIDEIIQYGDIEKSIGKENPLETASNIMNDDIKMWNEKKKLGIYKKEGKEAIGPVLQNMFKLVTKR